VWTLVIFLTIGGPSITIGGFTRLEDCQALGQINVELINPRAHFRCEPRKKGAYAHRNLEGSGEAAALAVA
jgi:hypothetical protein